MENTTTKDEITDIKAEMKQMNLISGHNKDRQKKESAQDILTIDADGLWVIPGLWGLPHALHAMG